MVDELEMEEMPLPEQEPPSGPGAIRAAETDESSEHEEPQEEN